MLVLLTAKVLFILNREYGNTVGRLGDNMNTENMYFVLYNVFSNDARAYYGYTSQYFAQLEELVKSSWRNGDIIIPVKIKNIDNDNIEKLCKEALKNIIS